MRITIYIFRSEKLPVVKNPLKLLSSSYISILANSPYIFNRRKKGRGRSGNLQEFVFTA